MKYRILLGTLLLSASAGPCLAVDDPEATDYRQQFEQRHGHYEKRIKEAPTTAEAVRLYREYQIVLEENVKVAYMRIMLRDADEQSKQLLKQSQQRWVKYRDREFAFIDHKWTRANFGSSYLLSRLGYKTSLLRRRLEQLFDYLASLSASRTRPE